MSQDELSTICRAGDPTILYIAVRIHLPKARLLPYPDCRCNCRWKLLACSESCRQDRERGFDCFMPCRPPIMPLSFAWSHAEGRWSPAAENAHATSTRHQDANRLPNPFLTSSELGDGFRLFHVQCISAYNILTNNEGVYQCLYRWRDSLGLYYAYVPTAVTTK
jgi:hypothetical protein